MRIDAEMTCRELVELVTDYLDDVLAPDERARFERHLEGCHGCRGYLDQVRQSVRALGRLTPPPLPAAACEELLVHFRAWTAARG